MFPVVGTSFLAEIVEEVQYPDIWQYLLMTYKYASQNGLH